MQRRRLLTGLVGAAGLLLTAACGVTSAPNASSSGATATLPSRPTATPPSPPTAVAPTPAPSPQLGASTLVAPAPPTPIAPVATSIGVLPPPASPTPAARPTTRANNADLPLFDTHVHYSEDVWGPLPIDRALALMDQAGTRLALVSSTPDTGTMRLYQAAPDRIIPVLRPYRDRSDMTTWHHDPSMPRYLEERLTLGLHRGIGEFHLNGDDARSPVVEQIVALAVRHRLVLHAHSDERAISHLFAMEPGLRILWAHAGFTGPSELRAMLDRHPNLMVETAIRGEIGQGGQLMPEWRNLFLAYPDRLMIGTDSYILSRWTAMPAILGEVRRWLTTLPAPVGEQIAWRNAATMIGVDEVVFRVAGSYQAG